MMSTSHDDSAIHVYFSPPEAEWTWNVRRRIDRMLNKILATSSPWTPHDKPVFLGRGEISPSNAVTGSTMRTFYFRPKTPREKNLHVSINVFGYPHRDRQMEAISILSTALRILDAPSSTPDHLAPATDMMDMLTAVRPNAAFELHLYPRSHDHEITFAEGGDLALEHPMKNSLHLVSSRSKLKVLLERLRPTLPLILTCSVEETETTQTVRLGPYTVCGKRLDPIHAMALINKFQEDIIASGHSSS